MKIKDIVTELFFWFLSLVFSLLIFIPQLLMVFYNEYINNEKITLYIIGKSIFPKGELIVLCIPLLCALGVDIILKKKDGKMTVKQLMLLPIFILLLFIGYTFYTLIYTEKITDIWVIAINSYRMFGAVVLVSLVSIIMPPYNRIPEKQE